MLYVIDSSVFIQAKRQYYRFTLCPGFWASIEWQYEAGKVCSIDRVKDEISGRGDDLSNWAEKIVPSTCFKASSAKDVVGAFGDVSRWVAAQSQYEPAARSEFFVGADPWLVAFAIAEKATLVTQEQLAPKAKNRLPIPNVCKAFGVPFLDTFDFLAAIPTQFHWSAPAAS